MDLIGSAHALYVGDASCDVTEIDPSVKDVVRRGILVSIRIRPTEDRIKEIESKIEEFELQRARSSTSSSSGRNESASVDVPPPQPILQNASPPSVTSNYTGQTPDSIPGTPWSEPGVLSRRGPLNLSLPGEASKKFLNMFMQRKAISGFELHVGRVIKSFQPESSDAPVPALFYAMLLLGCHFISDPELKFWENMFFERAKMEIDANIVRAHANDSKRYNPLHHLQAMVMIGQWFFLKSRLLEAHVLFVRATLFAVALGLHELDSRIYGHYVARSMEPSWRKAGRWSPRDSIELGEAINLWW
ncbi:unnamed protein product [Rhizoctonia solani]|uniref:Xylanolytic transcriptional activator regulatory domain-containing protein n=1 Tax=Rhizoctonia solani TaxID=456999 RepID=A0A8H3GEN0_9AGAM|nr:unnamed protein product [Rhizoctonia solani]